MTVRTASVSHVASSNTSASLRIRVNLALHHLFAACRFASLVYVVEEKNKGEQFGDFWDEILHYSLSTITMSVAALECYVNEFYADGQAQGPHLNPVSSGLFSEMIDRQSILDKYEFALALRSEKKLKRGENVVQNADVLIKLRNAIIHFQPEWDDTRDKHDKLSSQLESRVSKSPFLMGEPMFPRAWASAACAVWALKTTVNFLDYFCIEANIDNPLHPFRESLSEYSNGKI